MDKADRNNLNYLMSLTPDEFIQFMEESDEDDIAYALELVQREKASVLNRIEELNDSMFSESMDLSEAQSVLARFRL